MELCIRWKKKWCWFRLPVSLQFSTLAAVPPPPPSCNFVYRVFVYNLFVFFIILFLSRFALSKVSWYPIYPYTLLHAPAHQPKRRATLPPSIMNLFLNLFSLYLWFCPTSVRRNAVCGEVGGVDFVSPSPPLSSTPPSRRSATQPSSDQFHPNVTCPHVRLVSYMLMSIFVTTCNLSICIFVLAPNWAAPFFGFFYLSIFSFASMHISNDLWSNLISIYHCIKVNNIFDKWMSSDIQKRLCSRA